LLVEGSEDLLEDGCRKLNLLPRFSECGKRYGHGVRGADAVSIHGVAFGTPDRPAVAFQIESPTDVL